MKKIKNKNDAFERLMQWFRKTEQSEKLRLEILKGLKNNKN